MDVRREIEDLPPAVSPDCLNVQFKPGSVSSRDGLFSQNFDRQPYRAAIDYVKSTGDRYKLLFGGSVVKVEVNEGQTQFLDSRQTGGLTGTRIRGTTYRDMAWWCTTDSNNKPTAPPFSFNGTNMRRMTTSGPGAAPTIAASANVGTVPNGYYTAWVLFVTDNGYTTRPSPFSNELLIAGNVKIDVTGIPVGPPGTMKRLVALSYSSSSQAGEPVNFYHIVNSAMEVADNSTTSITDLNFTSAQLLAAQLTDPFLDQTVVRGGRGVGVYKDRTFVWGCNFSLQERPYHAMLMNFDFDGGFSSGVPLGWTQIVAGGSATTPAGSCGNSYRITGDGAALDRGTIRSGILWKLGVDAGLRPGKAYGVRVRVRAEAATPANRIFEIRLYNPTYTSRTSLINVSSMAEEWQVFEDDTFILSTDQFDASTALEIGMADVTALAAGEFVEVDSVELYPLDESDRSWLYIANPGVPEYFDGLTGFREVSIDDGQSIMDCCVFRDYLYVAKEGSFYALSDTGDAPSSWPVALVSTKVGAVSTRALDAGEGFVIIFSPTGIHFFQGGSPEPISGEIEPLLSRIDYYTAASRAWVTVDAANFRVHFGVPGGHFDRGSLYLTLDYREGWGESNEGVGRKWTPWTLYDDENRFVHDAFIETRSFYRFNDLSYNEGATQRVIAFLGGQHATNDIASPNTFTFAPWTLVSGTGPSTITGSQPDAIGGTNATRWLWAAPAVYKIGIAGAGTVLDGSIIIGFIWVKPNFTGTLKVGIEQVGGGGGGAVGSISVGPETVFRPVVISALITTGGGVARLYLEDTAGSVTHDMVVFGDVVQLGPINSPNYGFEGYTEDPGGEENSGWVARPNIDKPYDFCGEIEAYYETGPLRLNAVQRALYGYLNAEIKKKDGEFTTTTVDHELISPGETALPLPDREVGNTPEHAIEIMLHRWRRYVRYRIDGNRWTLSSLTLWAKKLRRRGR